MMVVSNCQNSRYFFWAYWRKCVLKLSLESEIRKKKTIWICSADNGKYVESKKVRIKLGQWSCLAVPLFSFAAVNKQIPGAVKQPKAAADDNELPPAKMQPGMLWPQWLSFSWTVLLHMTFREHVLLLQFPQQHECCQRMVAIIWISRLHGHILSSSLQSTAAM